MITLYKRRLGRFGVEFGDGLVLGKVVWWGAIKSLTLGVQFRGMQWNYLIYSPNSCPCKSLVKFKMMPLFGSYYIIRLVILLG